MKVTCLYKIISLALPAIILIYVFLIRDRLDAVGGVGGGMYDLTKMYTAFGIGLYLLILCAVLLLRDAGANALFILIGVAMLIVTVVIAVRSF